MTDTKQIKPATIEFKHRRKISQKTEKSCVLEGCPTRGNVIYLKTIDTI